MTRRLLLLPLIIGILAMLAVPLYHIGGWHAAHATSLAYQVGGW